jgi:DNA-binding protein HU-beta
MNRKELVGAVASKTGLTLRAADEAVGAVFDLIVREVAAGESVVVPGFGTFEARDRAAREGRNPQTGAPMSIPAGRVPAFKAGAGFRRDVAEG